MRLLGVITSITVGVLAAACASTSRNPYLPKSVPAVLPAAASCAPELKRDGQLPPVTLYEEVLYETKGHRSFFLTFPSVGKNGQKGHLVTGRYFQSKIPGEKKLVVILPIYGSSTYPPEIMSEHFTRWSNDSDTNVLLIQGDRDLFEWELLANAKTEKEFFASLKKSVYWIESTVADIRLLLNWAVKRPEVNPRRMGVVGFSIGAILASRLMNEDQRVSVGVFAMGGSNLHTIFARSDAEFIKPMQSNARINFGWDRRELEEKLKPIFAPIEPSGCLGKINPARVLIFDAEFDDYIPRNSRDAFWQELGEPERITFLYRHKEAFLFSMTILGFNYLDRTAAEFINKNL